MKPAIVLLTILVVGGAIVWLIDKLFYNKKVESDADVDNHLPASEVSQRGCTDESCGIRPICPSEQLLVGACREEATYYDDEELDAYAGRGEGDYSDDEMEQWRDVLYTLQGDDLLGWGQSIRRRGLVMPAAIREEFLQLAAEHHGPAGQ